MMLSYKAAAIIDYILCFFLISPLGILFWASTWELLDLYIFPDDMKTSAWISLAIGLPGCILLNWSNPWLDKHVLQGNVFSFFLISNLYNYFYNTLNLFYWRAVWEVMDQYTGYKWRVNLTTLMVSWGWLVLIRSSITIVATPLGVVVDPTKHFFVAKPRFRSDPDIGWKYRLDHVFSQVFVMAPVVIAWRSWWNILDEFVLPNDPVMSNLTTCLAGGFVSVLIMAYQRQLGKISTKLEKHFLCQLAYEDIVWFVVNLAGVAHWRGLWQLLQIGYENHEEVTSWPLHFGSYLALACLHTTNTGYNRDMSVDLELKYGLSISFNLDYIRYYLKHFIRDKTQINDPDDEEQKNEERKSSTHKAPITDLTSVNGISHISNGLIVPNTGFTNLSFEKT